MSLNVGGIMRIARIGSMAFALVLVCGGPVAAFHDGDHGGGPIDRTFKVGKTGEVNIGRDVKIGHLFVKRGKYTLTHRAEDLRHVFVLTEINKKKDPSQLVTVEIDGRFVPKSERVKKSAVTAKEQRDHSYEVVNIQIAGENGDHVFTTKVGGNNGNASTRN
jgi:hypothetical protein